MGKYEPPFRVHATLCTDRDRLFRSQSYPKNFIDWLAASRSCALRFSVLNENYALLHQEDDFDLEPFRKTIEQEGFYCILGDDKPGLEAVFLAYHRPQEERINLSFFPYDQAQLMIALEIADFFGAAICVYGRVIDANYKKGFLEHEHHNAAWETPPYGNQPMLARQMSAPLVHGPVRPYGGTWVLCNRPHLTEWKGDRFGEDGDYAPTAFMYIYEYFVAPEGEKNLFEREHYPLFMFYNERFDEHTLDDHDEYFYRIDPTTWGIILDFPGRPAGPHLYLSALEEVPRERVFSIGDQGAVMFPSWMSGEDLLDYPPGLHCYTPCQKAHDLIVLDVPAGNYRQYHLYALDEHGERQDVGFLMRRE